MNVVGDLSSASHDDELALKLVLGEFSMEDFPKRDRLQILERGQVVDGKLSQPADRNFLERHPLRDSEGFRLNSVKGFRSPGKLNFCPEPPDDEISVKRFVDEPRDSPGLGKLGIGKHQFPFRIQIGR